MFPEVGVVLGRIRQPTLVRSLTALNRSLRRRAASVVAIGRDMERRLIALGCDPAKIEVIPNWTDGSLLRPLEGPSRLRARCGWDGRFVVMHSGNVGRLRTDTLIAAADLLIRADAVRDRWRGVKGSGHGRRRAAWPRNVELLPYQPKMTPWAPPTCTSSV